MRLRRTVASASRVGLSKVASVTLLLESLARQIAVRHGPAAAGPLCGCLPRRNTKIKPGAASIRESSSATTP
jgi:hypothetical protein